MTNTPDSNKAVVRDFYDLAFNRRQPAEAVAKHVGNYYRQHNPGAADGREAFVEFVSVSTDAYPGLNVEFRRFVAERPRRRAQPSCPRAERPRPGGNGPLPP